jgi:hypothetical protein
MAIEIVDLPINSMVIFHSYVSLPEGTRPHYCWLDHLFVLQNPKVNPYRFWNDRSKFCLVSPRFVIRGFIPCINGLCWLQDGYEPFSKWNDWNDPPAVSLCLSYLVTSYLAMFAD